MGRRDGKAEVDIQMSFVIFQKHLKNTVCKRGVYVGEGAGMWGWGRRGVALQYFQIFKKVGQKLARQAARGLATVFFVTFLK